MSCALHSMVVSGELLWPFEAIRDREDVACEWVVLHGPVVSAAQQTQFAELRRRGARFAGMTSYLDFPRSDPSDGLDYASVCEVWGHCFRAPGSRLPQHAPHALISASDFTDASWLERAAAPTAAALQADVVYVGAIDAWQHPVKNWVLAARCLPRLWQQLGLRTLVVGLADDVFRSQPGIEFAHALDWPVLLATISRARMLFVPNQLDPSPRVLAEALCLNVPVLVHRGILGGWKYVNPFTGVFFEDERDVVDAASHLLAGTLAPAEWFRANQGPEQAGRRLGTLLRTVDPAIDPQRGWRITAAGPAGRRGA